MIVWEIMGQICLMRFECKWIEMNIYNKNIVIYIYIFVLLQGGVVKLKWDIIFLLVYIVCLDGVVRMWDVRNGKCCLEWLGYQDVVLDFDIFR